MADDPTTALPLAPTGGEPRSAPAPPLPRPSQVLIPLSADDLGRWRTRVRRSQQARKDWEPVWEQNLDAYQPAAKDLVADRERYDINPNVDFRQVEQKASQLFYDRPDVVLEPKEPITSELTAQQIVTLRQAVLNSYLGPKPDGVDVRAAVQQALKDILVTSGMGWTKIGWRVITRTVEPDAEDIAAGAPPEPIELPVYDKAFWEAFPATRGLKPHDALGADGDAWDWIGMEFTMPLVQAKREFALPDDFEVTTKKNPDRLRKEREAARSVPMVSGQYLEYYRARYHDDVVNPEVVYELVLIDGLEDRPARHRPCPYQTVQEDGSLTADSTTGYLIQTLTTRLPADGSDLLSDCSVTRPLVDELKTYRSQNLKQRDMAAPIILFKGDALEPEQRDDLKGNGYAHLIEIAGSEWRDPDPFKAIALPTQPRDSYEGAAILERDIERSLAIGANQSGAINSGRRSATEIQTLQANTDARLAQEQARLVDGFLKGVAKLDCLIQRMGKPSYVKILGPNGANTLLQVDPAQIPGRMLYTIRPDSQLRVDAAADRQQFLQLYNLVANSPSANRFEFDTVLVRKYGLDPTKMLTPPQPPPPPAPKISVSISMGDLLTPAAPIAVKLLTNQPVTPDDIAIMEQLKGVMPPAETEPGAADAPPEGQPEHPGPVERVEPLDAHQGRRTGMLQGTGQ